MAEGNYKLTKENAGGTFDEKNVQAEANKVLGFDAGLNPEMKTVVTTGFVIAMSCAL